MAKKIIVRAKSKPSDAATEATAAADGSSGEPSFPRVTDFAEFIANLPEVAPISCPICNATFAPEEALFVARHANLPHDLLLGPGSPYRFRPTRFTPKGEAIDPGGDVTAEAACPACHVSLEYPFAQPLAPRSSAHDKNAPEQLPPHLSTMEGVRTLIGEIQSLLNRTGSARIMGDVCARQYAELCRRANARLTLCQYFIRNNQPEAALDQAEQSPSLLDMCAMLPFPDLDQWGQLCARNRWAVPAPVDTVALDEVQASLRNARTFEPALAALRCAVLRGCPDEALRIMRTLLQMDPNNPLWWKDTERFELFRQRELLTKADEAIKANDVVALTAPATELAGPWLVPSARIAANRDTFQAAAKQADDWLIPPDPEMLERVQIEFDRLRHADAAQRGIVYTAQFAVACAKQDFEAAAAADTALATLRAEGFYELTESARQQIESGQAWFAAANARHKADANFAVNLTALAEATEKPNAAAEVERLRDAIRNTGREAPADLMARADLIVQQRQRHLRIQKRLNLWAKIAAAVVALELLGMLCWGLALVQQRSSCAKRLEQALQAEDLAAFDNTIADMSHGFRRIFGTSLTKSQAIMALNTRRNELATRIQNRSLTFQSSIVALQKIQGEHFEAPASQVLDLLARAKQAAKTMEDMGAINRFEEPWRADQNLRLAQALTQLPLLVPPATNVFITHQFAAATQQVVQYCAQVDAAASLLGANKSELEKVKPFAAMAQFCDTNLAIRLSALKNASTASTLNAYLDVLVRYTDRFTNDTLSLPLAEILTSRREYRAALQVTEDLQERISVIATNTAWPQARRAVLGLSEARALNNLRWARRKDTGEMLFLLEREKEEPGSHGKWADCYLPLSGDTTPLFQRARVTDEPPYHQGFSDQPSRLWPHTEIVNELLAGTVPIEQAEAGARFLEETFRRISLAPIWNGITLPGSNDMPNVAFKIQFLVFLADHLVRLSPLPEWKLILEELKSADIPEANWICLKSGDVLRINQEGAKAMARIVGPGGLLTRLDVRRAAHAVIARTPLIWAGYVDFGDAGLIYWRQPAPPASLVVLRPDAKHVRMIAINAGSPEKPCLPLIPGEPALAWSDGGDTAAKTAEICRLVGISNPGFIHSLLPAWYPCDQAR